MKTGRSRRGNASQIGSSSGVVDFQAAAIWLADVQPKALGDLADADGAGLDVGLELLDGLLAPSRTDVTKVDAGQHAEAVLVGAGVDGLERARQAFA